MNTTLTKILFSLVIMMILLFWLKPLNQLLLLNFPLLIINSTSIEANFMVDWMSITFMVTVSVITLSISIYSYSYIPTTEHKRFLLIMFLFALSMLILISSNNLIILLLGWDGLGLSSYILVIYYQNASTSSSGTITILSNRMGDIALLMTFTILFSSNSLLLHSNLFFPMSAMILFSIAAISKSAQFPFSAWLPAAMAAPTPISALVHSSTLVTAGVFLMIRLSTSFHPSTMFLLSLLSIFTALFASLNALWEQDMKKIIALSTLSQIAIMMFAISINTPIVAFFHLITHALFKSTMFLCAGNIIHNSSYQDMRNMGTLYYSSPTLFSTLGITAMALMGLPFTAGFFSKDAIMEFMLMSTMNTLIILLMISSIGLTTMYSLRMMMLLLPLKSKSPSNILISNNSYICWPPFFMSPLSIISGSTLAWATPTQTLILPSSIFSSITLALVSGILIGSSLSYKSLPYNTIGTWSIKMWFIHNLSTLPWMKSLSLSMHFYKLDNTWQEQISSQGVFKTMTNKKNSNITIKSTMILTILLTTPLFLIY